MLAIAFRCAGALPSPARQSIIGPGTQAGRLGHAPVGRADQAISRAGVPVPDPGVQRGAGGRLSTADGSRRDGERRAAAGRHEAEAPSAVHLARRAGARRCRARCGRGRDRARHPVLGEQLLHQGGARPELCLLAPGPHLLGPGAGRHRDRLDRALAEHARERLHARGPGQPQAGRAAAHRDFCRAQPALARPGDPGRGRRTSRPRTWSCSPARCRCITSS